ALHGPEAVLARLAQRLEDLEQGQADAAREARQASREAKREAIAHQRRQADDTLAAGLIGAGGQLAGAGLRVLASTGAQTTADPAATTSSQTTLGAEGWDQAAQASGKAFESLAHASAAADGRRASQAELRAEAAADAATGHQDSVQQFQQGVERVPEAAGAPMARTAQLRTAG